MNPQISVIVPVYNDARNLDTLLQSISSNSFKEFEVIVVDDASRGSSVKRVALSYNTRYFRHSVNRCVAAARNTGAIHARSGILLFLDSDVEIAPDTLLRFVRAYEKPSRLFFQALTSRNSASGCFGAELTAELWYFETITVERLTLYSLCFSIKRALFFRLGGFDECFTGLGAEEFEFAFRLEREAQIESDGTLLVTHRFQPVFPRAYSLFKRTIRYTHMFIIRTRRFDNQVGRPGDVLSALFSALSMISLLSASLPLFAAGVRFAMFLSFMLMLFLHSLVIKRLFLFLHRERGRWFAFRALPALYLWAASAGLGIITAVISFPFVVLFKKGYMKPRLLSDDVDDPGGKLCPDT